MSSIKIKEYNMGKINLKTKINIPNSGYKIAMVFNAYALKPIEDIILMAFILRDTNGYSISSISFSVLKHDLLSSIDSWSTYLDRTGGIRNTTYRILPYEFKNPYNIKNINVISSKDTSCEIKLSLYSHFSINENEEIQKILQSKSKSGQININGEAVALVRSNLEVHYNFLYDLIDLINRLKNENA